MELIIPSPLLLPDCPLSLDALETAILEWGLGLMQRALAAAWAAQAGLRPVPPCPTCQSCRFHRAGTKSRHLETRFGPVVLRRQRLRCCGCARYFQPDDAVLAPALGGGRCTPALATLAAQCGASWPYRQAATVLGMLRGTPISPETIRQIVAATGEALSAQYVREAATACQPPATAPTPTTGPAQVEVILDGAWIHAHDNAHGMEIKVGVVHTGSAACGTTHTRLTGRRYAATAAGIARFAPLVTAAIDRVDGFASPAQTLLGDGAAWIWHMGAEIVPEATPVLDRCGCPLGSMRDARRRATRAAVPEKEERRPWSVRLEAALDVGAVPEALQIVSEMQQHYPHAALAEFAIYLGNQAGRIPNYAARKAAGETIGSGSGEKGVEIVVNRRLKGRRGMRWWRRRADEVVALRLALLNDEWEQRLMDALAA